MPDSGVAKISGRPPVVIIGMHRSGTSLVSRLLEQLGLFVGWRKYEENEAVFFVRLNNWILQQCGAHWAHPEPVHDLVQNDQVRLLAVQHLRSALRGRRVYELLGPAKFLTYRSPLALAIPWGWKDPRNTYTLPLWLDIFPEAKVIHVRRHGVDVANSLMVRNGRVLEQCKPIFAKRAFLSGGRKVRRVFADVLRCTSLAGSFSLWECYVREAEGHVARLGGQARQVSFEELLEDPTVVLRGLARFCELSSSPGNVADVARQIEPARARGFLRDPVLRRFADQVAPRLEQNGYQV